MTLPSIPPLESPGQPQQSANEYGFALIINNVVYQRMRTDAQLASVFSGQPTFIQVDVNDPVEAGDIYDPVTGTFSKP
jgi:hypothetical protein